MDKGEKLVFLDRYVLLACQKYSLEVPSPPDRHHRSPLGVALFAISIQGEAKCYVGTETDAVQRLVFQRGRTCSVPTRAMLVSLDAQQFHV